MKTKLIFILQNNILFTKILVYIRLLHVSTSDILILLLTVKYSVIMEEV
jgi:hypothetical protein